MWRNWRRTTIALVAIVFGVVLLLMMDGMIECVKSGLTRTVGVSNFNQTQTLTAYSALARQNIPLASNQVHYSLLNRKVEKSGLLSRCKELGIRLIAYSPLAQGLMGKKPGDKVDIAVPMGTMRLEILKIRSSIE